MKLFHKLFLCFVVLFSIILQAAGLLLLHYSWKNVIAQEKRYAWNEFQYNKYILQSILYQEPELLTGEESLSSLEKSFTVKAALFDMENKCLFSNLSMEPEKLDFLAKEWAETEEVQGAPLEENVTYQIESSDEESRIFVYAVVSQAESQAVLVTETDIGSVVANQRQMTGYFQNIYLALLAVGFPVIFFFSRLLTRPLEKGSEAAKRIAEGNYSERIPVTSRDEIGMLASDFNRMAAQVEEKMGQLVDNARQKEDFAANFAHELKTPLTSVIGYADMLYQKELPREQVKNAAEYILNEGMRLEALSLKLMDLFVLEKQEFTLERMAVGDIFEDLALGLRPICEKRGVFLHMRLQPGIIGVDYDLFKTMMLNLIDNAVKADSSKIILTGEKKGVLQAAPKVRGAALETEKTAGKGKTPQYEIVVSDNGKGIPKEELGRITEAFYMVDKSRSRKQHGAGLGMALVAKILEIHEGTMEIESEVGQGTRIMLTFPSWEEGDKEEDDHA